MAHQGSGVATSGHRHVGPGYARTGLSAGGTAVAGAVALYDAGSLAALADNAAVSSWADTSGQGRNLGAGYGPSNPHYHKTTTPLLNGHPAVYFAGGATNVNNLATATFTCNAPWTIAAAVAFAGAFSHIEVLCEDNTGEVPGIWFSATGVMEWFVGGAKPYGTALAVGDPGHTLVCVLNGASSAVYVDGAATSPTSGTPTSVNITGGLNVGSDLGGTGLGGALGELALWPFAFTPAQAGAQHAYLAAKWGTP